MAEVANESGHTALQLRRVLHHHNEFLCELFGGPGSRTCLRDMLSYACVSYAAHLIGHGTKIQAARGLAGFNLDSKSTFKSQFRATFGCLPNEFRDRQMKYEGLGARERPE